MMPEPMEKDLLHGSEHVPDYPGGDKTADADLRKDS
jgi:hypothetical protein